MRADHPPEPSLTVACLELPAAFGNVSERLEVLDRELAGRPACDLVLLPECALTGYVSPTLDFDLRPFAEHRDGSLCQALATLAKKHRVALVGGFVERDGDRFFNSTIGFEASGSFLFRYQKRHPWYPETWATPGSNPLPLFQFGHFTFSCAVCFDAHFLEAESALELETADVLLFPSAWVDETESRPPLLQHLALRFGLDVVNANWGHGTPRLLGQGDSVVIGRNGQRISSTDQKWITARIVGTAAER
jgi:5-aminopentanamidase